MDLRRMYMGEECPRCIPNINEPDVEFENYFLRSEWGQRIVKASDGYNFSAKYRYVEAKDVVSLYTRTPKPQRETLINALIEWQTVVTGMNLRSPPRYMKALETEKFSKPFFSCSSADLKENVIYVYVDGCAVKPQKQPYIFAGWAYMMALDGTVIDEGAQEGSNHLETDSPTDNFVQVAAIRLGLQAGYNYLNEMDIDERKKVKYVCLRSDSKYAIAQAIGSSNADKPETREMLWDIYNLIGHFEDIKFELIPSELNGPADLLADYARCYHQNKQASYNKVEYEKLCSNLLMRKVMVGHKMQWDDKAELF